MPPKVRITKEDIIGACIDLVRAGGQDAINARAIAAHLDCSTQPIFSNFTSMEELEKETIEAAYALYLTFLTREVESGEYPPYKAYGMAYVRFAKEEKQLFKALFMCDRKGQALIPSPDFSASVDMLMQTGNLTREQAELWHMEMWSCVHGIGTMLATSFLELDYELISQMLSDIYHGLRARYMGG